MRALPRRLLWVLLIGVALALVLLIARHDQEPFGRLATGDLGALAYHLALVLFIGGGMVAVFPAAATCAAPSPPFLVGVELVALTPAHSSARPTRSPLATGDFVDSPPRA